MHKPFFRRFGRWIALSIILLLISGSVYVVSNWLFTIEQIDVEGQGIDVVVDNRLLPKNLLFFPSARVKETILRNNPLLTTLEFQKKFPHTLLIIAYPRQGMAILAGQSVSVVLDQSGMVLGVSDGSKKFPIIHADATVGGIGSTITDMVVVRALQFLLALGGSPVISDISAFDSSSMLAKTDKTDIIIPQSGDMRALGATLQTLLSGFRIRGTMPSRIDLRFNKPVVQF